MIDKLHSWPYIQDKYLVNSKETKGRKMHELE